MLQFESGGFRANKKFDTTQEHGITVETDLEKSYSIDQNMWGRSIECGVLENPESEPPSDVYEWTNAPENAPNNPEYVAIEFERGIPVAVNGERLGPIEIVQRLNYIGGKHGVGRIDHIEDRLVESSLVRYTNVLLRFC